MRSLQLTSAHNIPAAPSSQSRTERPPAADITSRRSAAASSVGTSAMSQRTIKMLVAEVDHGSETTTAVASPSAIWASRGARTRSFTPVASRLRWDIAIASAVDLALGSAVIKADPGGFPQHRQAALRARAIAAQHHLEPRIIGGQLPAVGLRMP